MSNVRLQLGRGGAVNHKRGELGQLRGRLRGGVDGLKPRDGCVDGGGAQGHAAVLGVPRAAPSAAGGLPRRAPAPPRRGRRVGVDGGLSVGGCSPAATPRAGRASTAGAVSPGASAPSAMTCATSASMIARATSAVASPGCSVSCSSTTVRAPTGVTASRRGSTRPGRPP